MPLEVREIGIRLSVGTAHGAAVAGDVRGQAGDGGAALRESERAAIVEQCVRAVIDRLQRGSER